ncbi:MAG: glycerol kinase GlpK [Parasporobacterium sp.]|nr:glycerol kinase GlpK [Parasporobacterium sp.]
MKKYVIAMDQGTTSSRCILFNEKGEICSIAQKELVQVYPQPGWVEHDPMEIWYSVMSVTVEAMQRADVTAADIAAIGITNQRETTIVWDAATGNPIYNGICWQCRRTSDRIEQLRSDGLADMIHARTGLIPDAYFSASKIEWILDHVPGARKRAENGELRFGTVDSWLIWNLTEGRVHVTDYTNASRTMLFDIHNLCWDQEILDYFRIPASMLPEVRPSSCIYGETLKFGDPILVAGDAGDQQAALFGQCGFSRGDVKNTYGTGGFMLMNTGSQPVISDKGLLTTIAATSDGSVQYVLEGSVFIAGAAIQWLRDELRLIDRASETEYFCESVEDTNGVYVVPAFSGMGAPYWEPYARGTIVGLTRGAGKAHLIRAMVESLAYQTNDLLQFMRTASGLEIAALKVDGGACANNFLMQFQADISDVQIQRPECIETTALGAAYLAGLAAGFWKDQDQIRTNWKCSRVFESRADQEKRTSLLKGWSRAVNCAIDWAHH